MPSHDVIGELINALLGGFVTHFRPADDHFNLRRDGLQHRNELGRLFDVPNVDAESNYLRVEREQLFHEDFGFAADHKLDDPRLGANVFVEIGKQIAKPKRRMCVAGVERGENECGHGRNYRRLRRWLLYSDVRLLDQSRVFRKLRFGGYA